MAVFTIDDGLGAARKRKAKNCGCGKARKCVKGKCACKYGFKKGTKVCRKSRKARRK